MRSRPVGRRAPPRAAAGFSPADRWQRSRCPGSPPRCSSAGTSVHRSKANRQRGRKWQPCGGEISEGGWPSICASRSTRGPVDPRDRAEQSPRVGVLGLVEDLLEGADLDHPPAVHDEHPVGDLGDDAEVVGDQDRRDVLLAVELLDQPQDLRLDRHVERGRRLVGDQDLAARARAPSRSSPAGASRRRTRAGSWTPAPRPRGSRPTSSARSPARRPRACRRRGARGSSRRSGRRPGRPG